MPTPAASCSGRFSNAIVCAVRLSKGHPLSAAAQDSISIQPTSSNPIRWAHSPYLWLLPALLLGLAIAQLPFLLIGSIAVGAVVAIAIYAHPKAVYALLLVLAPLRTLYATEAPRLGYPTLPLDIGQWLVLALVASWVLHYVRRRQMPLILSHQALRSDWAPLLPLFAFVTIAASGAFTAFSLNAWLLEWLKWLQVTMIALITIDICIAGHRRSVVGLLVLAGAANAVIGIYQYFGGSGALHLLVNDRYFRAFGTFGQPNPFGGFMGVLFPMAFTGMLAALYSGWRLIRGGSAARLMRAATSLLYFGSASCLVALALILSWSRGAWLGFGVSVAVMLFALPRKAIHSLFLAFLLAGMVGALAASGRLPASISARLATITEDIFNVQDVRGVDITPANYAVVERLAHWQAAIDMATAHPWLGVGLGNYEIAYPEFRLANWKFALGHAHNMYLNMLAEVGLVGLIAYLALIFAILWYAWSVRRHPSLPSRLIAIGILGVWTYVIVHSLTDNLYVNNVFIHLGVTIGLLASLLREVPRRTTC